MGEWIEYRLGDLGVFSGGVTSIKPDDYGFGTPFIPYTNVYRNSRVDVGQLQLMNVTKNDLDRKNCLYGDIFFTAASETDDEVAMSSVLLDNVENLTFNGFCKRYRLHDFETLLPEYARYYFRSHAFRREVFQRVNGDIRYNISQASLKEIPIVIPAIDEQRAIASVLSSLDAKIDLLHRQNKTLEGMAEALFRQWYLEGDGEPVPVTEIIDFNPSLPLKKGLSAPYLEMKNLQETSSIPDGIRYREFTSGMRFQNGDTLLARISPCLENGKCCYVQCMKENEVGWGSTEFIVMRSKKGFSPFLSYALAKSPDFVDYAANTLAGSSGRQRAQLEIMMEFQLVRPDATTIETVNAQLDGFAKRIDLNHRQITNLTTLRDTLLPKLMSGEVRVEMEHAQMQ